MKKLNVLLALVFPFCYLSFAQENNVQTKQPQKTNSVPDLNPEDVLKPIRQRLVNLFDEYLKKPTRYRKTVIKECQIFPEGNLFPYIYPAMAYVNLALKDSEKKNHYARQARKLLDLAVASVTRRLRPPGGKLENLKDYRKHAMYLGQLNLALGAYCLISDDSRYDVLHRKLSGVLQQGMVKANGKPLESFPEYSWPFDTIPVLVSLQLYDLKTSSRRSADIISKHLKWIRENATSKKLGLPYSRIDNDTGKGKELPRGCDLSFRLCLLQHLDPDYAKKMYKKYVKSYWIDKNSLVGFAEWPGGKNKFTDMDSGPIVMGIGLGATGLGIGTVIALNDRRRLKRLCLELSMIDVIRPLFVMAQKHAVTGGKLKMIPLDRKHYTGFLFGDAMLFYCATWCPWNNNISSKK